MPIEFTPSSCKQNLLQELSLHGVEPHRSCPCFLVTPKKYSCIFHPCKNPHRQGHTPIRLWSTAQVTQTWTPSFDLAIVVCTTHCMFTTRAVLRAVPVDACACGIDVSVLLYQRTTRSSPSLTSWYVLKFRFASCYQNAIFLSKIQSTPLTKLATQKSRGFFCGVFPSCHQPRRKYAICFRQGAHFLSLHGNTPRHQKGAWPLGRSKKSWDLFFGQNRPNNSDSPKNHWTLL